MHGGSNERSEVISTKPTGLLRPPTADADADRDARPRRPRDPPRRTRSRPLADAAPPTPRAAIRPPQRRSAIADFTTLPAASQCVRNRKLTVRMKKPPKGYTVKTVTVKVNAKRVATLKAQGAQEAAVPAQAAARDVHRDGLDQADEGQGPDRATPLHGL